MDKTEFITRLNKTVDTPEMIRGIYNWCDRWCERCHRTERCMVYKTTVHLPADDPGELFQSLTLIFEATIDMLKEHLESMDSDVEDVQNSDFEDEYNREKQLVANNEGTALARQYKQMAKHWLDSLKERDSLGMEIRMQNAMLQDCMEVIQWHQYLFEIKFARALVSQKEELEENFTPYDSLGTAKLLLVTIERNIGAWGYVYQQFKEDEDELLAILVVLQKLRDTIRQTFPDADAFIRPGLDD